MSLKFLFFLFLLFFPISSNANSYEVDTYAIVGPQNIDDVDLTRREKREREATVLVETPFGTGTGTYFTWHNHTFVITAAHVVSRFPLAMIHSDENSVMGTVIYQDTVADIAVLRVENLNIRPIKYRPASFVSGVGTDVYYTGYPMQHYKIGIHGEISSYWYSPDDFYILINGFGWAGSSGSSVFDRRGHLVGIVSAVQSGQFNDELQPQIVTNIVWIKPIILIDHDELLARLMS